MLKFLPKNGKNRVKKSLSSEKISRFFLSQQQTSCLFLADILHDYPEKRKMRSAFAERTSNKLLFFVSEVVDMRTQILAFLCFGRQKSLNNDSILQTFLLQATAILIRLGNIAIN